MKKTHSKKQQIIEMLKIGKKPAFIAKQLGVKVQTVYSTKWLNKKKIKPVGSLNVASKRVRPKIYKPSTEVVKYEELTRKLTTDNLKLMDDNKFLVKEVEKLRHQVTGFRAVVSYLENQVGLRNSQ